MLVYNLGLLCKAKFKDWPFDIADTLKVTLNLL